MKYSLLQLLVALKALFMIILLAIIFVFSMLIYIDFTNSMMSLKGMIFYIFIIGFSLFMIIGYNYLILKLKRELIKSSQK